MNASILHRLIHFAQSLADVSGDIVRRSFRRPVEVSTKPDATPVTDVDREVEGTLRALIEEQYPHHGILGEEFPALRPDAEHVWVIDPIDGTKAFITGLPVFGTLIALVYRGVPILGILDQPVSGERWVGGDASPTTLNDRPVRVRACADLASALLFVGSPEQFRNGTSDAYHCLREATRWAVYGANCYAYGQLARGLVDVGVEAGLDPVDFCALAPIVEGAGGIITDWQGAPLTLRSSGKVLAAGDPRVHAAALRVLAGA